MEKLSKKINEMIDEIKKRTGNNPDIIYRKVPHFAQEIYFVYIESLVDRNFINDFILEPINDFTLKNNKEIKNTYEFLRDNLPVSKIGELDNMDELMYNLHCGFVIGVFKGEEKCLSIEAKGMLHSPIAEAKQEKVIKGPSDGFTENYQSNVGLVRKRVKSEQLRLQEFVVGTRGKTKIGVMYLEDVADLKIVDEIVNRIKLINIDILLDSNYIIEMITDNRKSVFNNFISTERPDTVSFHVTNGRIVIIMENTPFAIVVPGLFFDNFHSPEDFYQKTYNAIFTRLVRMVAFLVTVIIPAFYISVTTYNQEAIPSQLMVSFAIQRDGVPFPSAFEAIFLILIFEILKETDVRTPTNLGSALSIVGSIVLGDAAVKAGLVSPIMVIVIAITSISGLILPIPDMSNGARIWRIIFLFLASLAGIFGVMIASLLLIVNLVSINSFGVPYVTPIAPFIKKGLGNIIYISHKRKYSKRSMLFAPNNQTKGSDLK